MQFHEVLRLRRSELGMSQAALAAAVGVNVRMIRRYETGQAHPALPVAVHIANTLGISLSELAGLPGQALDLGGVWWAAWQTWLGGREIVTIQQVNFHHHREIIQVHALDRGLSVAKGGYLWTGQLQVWDHEILMGWYAAADGATRSKGTMYFDLRPHGQEMTGRWVGLSYDSTVETGWGALARTKPVAKTLIDNLRQSHPQPVA